MSLSNLSKQDLIDLLEKASVLVDTVIQALPDDIEFGEDNLDVSPLDYLMNAAGDIQDAINGLSGD